jgi:hypothetical protein
VAGDWPVLLASVIYLMLCSLCLGHTR